MPSKLFGMVPDVHEDPPLEVLRIAAGPLPKIPPIGLPPTAVQLVVVGQETSSSGVLAGGDSGIQVCPPLEVESARAAVLPPVPVVEPTAMQLVVLAQFTSRGTWLVVGTFVRFHALPPSVVDSAIPVSDAPSRIGREVVAWLGESVPTTTQSVMSLHDIANRLTLGGEVFSVFQIDPPSVDASTTVFSVIGLSGVPEVTSVPIAVQGV